MFNRNPPSAVRDPARLDALRRLDLLDAPEQVAFDRLTRLVRHMLGVPVALVSLVDEDRQFFLSAQGLPEIGLHQRQTPLEQSLCQYVVESRAALRLEDAPADPALRDHQAVTELGVVAYLGMPLISADGHALGSICAIDVERRIWSEADEHALSDLAAITSNELALREIAGQLEARVSQEVTARLAAEAEVARKRRLEVLGQLAGGVAHDFANVLQTVQAGVRLAVNNLERDPAKAALMLDRVAEAARRGGSVTRRLLSFARRGAVQVQLLDAATLLQDLQEVLAHTLNQPGLQIEIEAEPGLPLVRADPGELETVIVNLATNARDAMAGGGKLRLIARAERVAAAHPAGLPPGAYVALAVADAGIGMAPETLARASEPFFTTKPPGEGTGLGLSMARDFAAQANGAFQIESALGVGTTVTLWLPSADENFQIERPQAERPGPAQPQ